VPFSVRVDFLTDSPEVPEVIHEMVVVSGGQRTQIWRLLRSVRGPRPTICTWRLNCPDNSEGRHHHPHPLAPAPFAPLYGITDRFGVTWIVGVEAPQH